MALAEPNAAALLTATGKTMATGPRSVVLNLWGTATLRTGGEDLALALILLGVRPVWDGASARVNGFEILRSPCWTARACDVTPAHLGLFRDAFAAQITLFDAAVQAIAAGTRRPTGTRSRPPSARASSAPPPANTAPQSAGRSSMALWTRRAELAATWLAASAGSYGAGRDGAPDPAALATASARRTRSSTSRTIPARTCSTAPIPRPFGGCRGGRGKPRRRAALYYMDGRVRSTAEQIARIVRGGRPTRAGSPA